MLPIIETKRQNHGLFVGLTEQLISDKLTAAVIGNNSSTSAVTAKLILVVKSAHSVAKNDCYVPYDVHCSNPFPS